MIRETMDGSIVMFYLIIIIFYIPVVFLIIQRRKQRRAVSEFYRGVKSIIEHNDDINDSLEQIAIIYKKISENYSYISDNYRSNTDMIEDLLYKLEALKEKDFIKRYDIEFTVEQKKRIVELIQEMKKRQPFSSLNSKHGNLLNLIKTAIDNDNKDLGISTIKQMSDEVEILEGTIKTQSKRNQISMIVSAVGVVLTLVFGVITIIQSI